MKLLISWAILCDLLWLNWELWLCIYKIIMFWWFCKCRIGKDHVNFFLRLITTCKQDVTLIWLMMSKAWRLEFPGRGESVDTFGSYSEQIIPSKQERMLKPSNGTETHFPSNMYQKNGLHHGETFTVHHIKYMTKKGLVSWCYRL